MRASHTVAAIILTAALASASSAQTRSGGSRESTKPSVRSNDPVKMTGCVSEERSGVHKDYVLTNAKVADPTNAFSRVKIPSEFTVTGTHGSELKNHVGHQVEVVGTFSNATARDIFHPDGVAGPTPGATGSSTTKESGGSTTGGVTTSSPVNSPSESGRVRGGDRNAQHASPNRDLPRIEAISVRMVAASCSAQ